MKKIGLLITFIVLFSSTVGHSFNTVHVYINGRVSAVDSNTITIEESEYAIDPKCKVVIVSKNNGIFNENPVSIHNVNKGDIVTAKKIANTIYEIMIERWRV